jgi:hypothetical protein
MRWSCRATGFARAGMRLAQYGHGLTTHGREEIGSLWACISSVTPARIEFARGWLAPEMSWIDADHIPTTHRGGASRAPWQRDRQHSRLVIRTVVTPAWSAPAGVNRVASW